MIRSIEQTFESHRQGAHQLLKHLTLLGKDFLYNSDLASILESYWASAEGDSLKDSPLAGVLDATVEVAMLGSTLYLAIRDGVASWHYVHVDLQNMSVRETGVSEYLRFKERIVDPSRSPDDWTLCIDLSPFERDFPKMKQSSSIGYGVDFLNRQLAGLLLDRRQGGFVQLFEFLKVHKCRGAQLMLNELIRDYGQFQEALRQAEDHLRRIPEDSDLGEVQHELRRLGFEPGWGSKVSQMREMMDLLTDILEAPDPEALAKFLSRVPMIFSMAIISPHGYFGQNDVLGMPDTGGQVVYILDQVRALERQMRLSIREQGLDVEPEIVVVTRLIPEAGHTTCDEPVEPISGTKNAKILRVPFRNSKGEVIREWISRFKIWPYLERFALDAEKTIVAELDGKPDLVIGNYSDGNLVGSILSQRMSVTQCNIAHALEKSKYFNSDLYWRDFEKEHCFSCQFTADLIAMNTADFIITSTYQEIAGTERSRGQYEDFMSFTLPGLYRVRSGIDVFDPKFNIVSPGSDPEVFFPHKEESRRPENLKKRVRKLIFGPPDDRSRGSLADPNKPLIFAMSRLDSIKNSVGLVEAYAINERLAESVNLLVVGGFLDSSRSVDPDEQKQIELMHSHFDKLNLDGKVRWVEMQTDKTQVGEFYRVVADSGGAFVQPALYEAFGLTVIEAMATGLPTFATDRGGPLEIIEDGRSGFLIDPHRLDLATGKMFEFFHRCESEPDHWRDISEGALERVRTNYTWELYAEKLLAQSRIYGFWKYITKIQRQETRRYIEMFYGMVFRPLAARLDSREQRQPSGLSPDNMTSGEG